MDKHIEAIDNFNQQLVRNLPIEQILKFGIDIYSKILELDYSAVFLFDLNTFEPILMETIPTDNTDKADYLLALALRLDLISEIMNSNSLLFREIDEEGTLILAPLVCTRGALGFVLMQTKNSIDKISDREKHLIKIFNGHFALSINNHNLELESKGNINNINQLVALQTQDLLEKKQEISEKVEQLKSSLLMTLPHEVRTPLNQILGLTDFLKNNIEELEGGESKEILEDVHSSAVRLRRLFENYLYLSTIIITSYDIVEMEELQKSILFSAESLISETATGLTYTYEKKGAITMNLEDASLCIKEEHFNKIIYELVDNALKFTQREPKIEINSTINDKKYVITIVDNGIGLPLEKIYMLDAYIQFDRLKNEQQGSGLGLAIVKKIIEIYNGKIHFTSESGLFTKITIELPIASETMEDI